MLANISYILQALPFLSICLQRYYSLQTTCLQTYHMFASQHVNPPWIPCKNAPQQASDSQFPLQVRWFIRMMEWHLLVTPMLAREDRCISLFPSLFMGVLFGNFFWWVCLPDQHQVSLIILPSTMTRTLADIAATLRLVHLQPHLRPPPGGCRH